MTHDHYKDGQAAPTAPSCRDAMSLGGLVSEKPFFFSFAKRWSDSYDNDSIPKEDLPYVKELRLLLSEFEVGSIELFMRVYEDDFISPLLETIIRLYGNIKKIDLDEPTKETIWLDDRTYSAYYPNSSTSPPIAELRDGGLARLPEQSRSNVDQDAATNSNSGVRGDAYSQSASARYSPTSRCPRVPLTAKMLYTFLSEERFNAESSPDSDRRLIFILNPDGHDFLALIETASHHQYEALTDVIVKYHTLRPSMSISLSTKGFSSYQLSFHLPFFAMRTDTFHGKRTNFKPRREWMDLSFVAQVLPETSKAGELGLYPAQISFTICGTSVKQYVAYGFEDAEFDADREFGENEFSVDGKHADQMTKGEEDANRPIWDPREYFLLVLSHRIRQVRLEWEGFILTVELAFTMRMSHPLRWHHRLLGVLRRTLPVLEDILDVWDIFLGANGDYHYFSNSTAGSDASRFPKMLHNINKEFEELRRLHRTLSRVQSQCEKEETSTGARMMQQNNYIAMLMVQWLGPLGLVISFFAIEKPIMDFKRNLVSFTGFNLVLMLLVHLVRVVGEGHMYRPQWCGTIATRAESMREIRRANVTRTATGEHVIQRRQTHS